MTNSEIREIFHSFFIKKNHHKVLSSPLIPAKDPTILFTNAGMNQFKSVFLQEEKREYTSAVSIQKCMRVSGKHNDFNEVGKTEFHHTFFEMLGNFSFGGYFKEKAIEYAWELLTDHYFFKPEKLWISIFEDDDESFKIWKKNIGVPTNKIIRFGEKINFWQMGETGPCGPCSEIYFDRGKNFGPDDLTENNSRYIEVWNLVFMQYYKDKTGKLNPLPVPSIDTGMGMERLTAILQNANSNYETDLFKPITDYISELSGISTNNKKYHINFKVIADHIRALSFLVSDGILPSNDGRGYVLRRILRRAAKHGKSLGLSSTFLYKISSKVIDVMKEFYPELEHNRNFISEVIQAEEERFNKTLLNGLEKFEESLKKAIKNNSKIISGKELFKLSDTFGFPLDFAVDLANEKEILIDHKGFQDELKKQRKKSRIGFEKNQKLKIKSIKNISKFKTIFTGYNNIEEEAKILSIYIKENEKPIIKENQEGILIFDKTPFYAESGGQAGDTGVGKNNNVFLNIISTQKVIPDGYLHYVQIKQGKLKVGDKIRITVDKNKRQNTAIHHTSTHLLHYALREILGLHVKQAGSSVGPEKLRFDFTHFKALSKQELNEVENIVNQKIRENSNVEADTLEYEQAIKKGAIAIFEEKYSDTVRLISVGDFSKELCGGTHLHSTGEIGIFKIINESSISAGIRRIEAIAGEIALKTIQENLNTFYDIQSHFKQKQNNIFNFFLEMEKNLKENKKLSKKTRENKSKINLNKIIKKGVIINNVNTIVEYIKNYDKKELSILADKIKNKTKGITVLSTNINGKSTIVVSIFKKSTKKINAGIIIKEIAKMINGNGGGRTDFAQAGGDSINNILDFKKNTKEIIKRHLK